MCPWKAQKALWRPELNPRSLPLGGGCTTMPRSEARVSELVSLVPVFHRKVVGGQMIRIRSYRFQSASTPLGATRP